VRARAALANPAPQVWIPSLQGIDGASEEKLVAVAGTRLLTELPGFNQQVGKPFVA
jgi:hypothetical protein